MKTLALIVFALFSPSMQCTFVGMQGTTEIYLCTESSGAQHYCYVAAGGITWCD